MKTNKTIRTAVIGTGYLGKFHAQKYARMENIEFIGVVDVDANRAKEIAMQFSTNAFTSHFDLIGKVDAVSIVVPTPLHYEISKDFLNNNVDVLIEKPMTTTIEEADELINLAESKDLIVQVGHLERFNPAVVALRDIIKNPLFIECNRISMYKPRCTDVSVVLDLMIHDIDLIQNIVRSPIANINAAGVPVISSDVDIGNARLEFESGCIANVTASRIALKNERKIRIFQKDSYVSVDFASKDVTYIRREDGYETSPIPGMNIQKIHLAEGDALDDEIKSFINAVKTRSQPEVSGKAGRDALKTALDISQQMKMTRSKIDYT